MPTSVGIHICIVVRIRGRYAGDMLLTAGQGFITKKQKLQIFYSIYGEHDRFTHFTAALKLCGKPT